MPLFFFSASPYSLNSLSTRERYKSWDMCCMKHKIRRRCCECERNVLRAVCNAQLWFFLDGLGATDFQYVYVPTLSFFLCQLSCEWIHSDVEQYKSMRLPKINAFLDFPRINEYVPLYRQQLLNGVQHYERSIDRSFRESGIAFVRNEKEKTHKRMIEAHRLCDAAIVVISPIEWKNRSKQFFCSWNKFIPLCSPKLALHFVRRIWFSRMGVGAGCAQ